MSFLIDSLYLSFINFSGKSYLRSVSPAGFSVSSSSADPQWRYSVNDYPVFTMSAQTPLPPEAFPDSL